MATLTVFNFITLNGFYKGTGNDISWHRHWEEESKYSEEMLAEDNVLLLGRLTYEMMAAFWPTPIAKEHAPIVAKGMNEAEKIVFSTSLKTSQWNHSSIVSEDIIGYTKHLKETSSKNLALLGSGSILTQFAQHGLIDEYKIMIDPVAIGAGTPLLNGLKYPLELQLVKSKIFKSGTILIHYQAPEA